MCRCTPSLRTPWCGKPGCEAPAQKKPEGVRANPIDELIETGGMSMLPESTSPDPVPAPNVITAVYARSDFDPGLACLSMMLGEDYDTTAARFPHQPGAPVPPTEDPYFVWSPDIVWAAAQAGTALASIVPREQHKNPSRVHAPTGGELWDWLLGRRAILLVAARRQEGRVTYVFWNGMSIFDPQAHRRPANHYPSWERPELLEVLVRVLCSR